MANPYLIIVLAVVAFFESTFVAALALSLFKSTDFVRVNGSCAALSIGVAALFVALVTAICAESVIAGFLSVPITLTAIGGTALLIYAGVRVTCLFIDWMDKTFFHA